MMRKRLLHISDIPTPKADIAGCSLKETSIPDGAIIMVTSEMSEHPIDHIFDSHHGPGSNEMVAEEPGDQSLVLTFDTPRSLRKVSLEVEETNVDRTQELTLAISYDEGRTYREVFRQEYNFSPPATTFEREEWCVQAACVTNLWVWLRPDKGNAQEHRATITSLTLQ